MKYGLLIGAGFTRNWGGWLTNEITGELLGRLAGFADISLDLKLLANYEELFSLYRRRRLDPGRPRGRHDEFEEIQSAISFTFRGMNLELSRREVKLDEKRRGDRSVGNFLAQFDAIFTLNHDAFLEIHYGPFFNKFDPPARVNAGCYLPGIKSWNWKDSEHIGTVAEKKDGHQPIYKLHGSANWTGLDNYGLIIAGTDKARDIAEFQLLREYKAHFDEFLCAGSTRLMVIGYGFGDDHINASLLEGGRRHSLQMFVVDPRGLDLFKGANRSLMRDIALAGVSTRPLTETFGRDAEPSLDSFYNFLGIRTADKNY